MPNILFSFFTFHIVAAHLKDFNNAEKSTPIYNDSIPIELYIGYSHNPWGTSQLITQKQQLRENEISNRNRRSVFQLYNMVVCATGCNPLLYKGYGCYCGFLGSGYPVDSIDSCCKMHDWCYDRANCPMFLEYFIPYVWTCHRRRPLCSMGHTCSQRLCECDRKLAECLGRYHCPARKAVCSTAPWRNHIWKK